MGQQTFKTYNLDQLSFSFAGMPITGGYGEGGSVSIKRNSELFETVVGRSGDVVRSRTNDKSGIVELTLLQTSPDNAKLAAMARLDDGTPNGAGVGVLQIRDRENGDLYTAAKAWIQKLPDTTFERKASDRVWTIACAALEFHPGGRPGTPA